MDHGRNRTPWNPTPSKRLLLAVVAALSLLVLLGFACEDKRHLPIAVTIRTTEFGIPHIKSGSFAGLGYGLGYAYARDNLCILAREIVSARGEETRFFGEGGGRTERSILFSFLNREENLRAQFVEQPQELQDAVHGYAAGYNRWLEETGVENLPGACAGEPWVRPIDFLDLAAVHAKGNTRASVSPLNGAIVAAAPPTAAAATAQPFRTTTSATDTRPLAPADLPERFDLPDELEKALNINERFGGGSNAYGLGRDVTTNGRGMLLGNPHEPWTGIQRFYEAHLEVPGRYDVMGVTQIALPVIVIGFNDSIAWSHTISTAKRFTVHELALDPTDPLAYFVEDENGIPVRHTIEAIPVEYEVLGESQPRVHTLYRSQFGFMMSARALSNLAPAWGDDIRFLGGPESVAYTIQDANERNLRGIEQWLEMGRARSIPELKATLEEILGIPFVNTIAADKHGDAFYADIGTVPNVTMEKLQDCAGSLVAQVLSTSGLIALDGSRAACDVDDAPGTPQPGVLGPEDLPSLIRSDFVTNSNDSYWLSNPEERLEGFSPVLRRDTFNEASPRILRTRMGLIQIRDRLAGRDGLPGNVFDLERLQQVFYGNRNYSAELELDAILDLCDSGDPPIEAWPTSGGGRVDATLACDVLATWDRRDDIPSIGAPVWRQFFGRLGRQVEKFAVPFDPANPIDTPRTLIINDTVIEAFGDAIAELEGLGLPLDAPLGELQFVTDDGEPRAPDDSNVIPMHGGQGQNGVFNVATTSVGPDGFTPIESGPTYMQTVTWDDRGEVVAEAILAFSQSDDPENPHFADQTRRYSSKEFIPLPFNNRDIQRQTVSRERLVDHLVIDLVPEESVDTRARGLLRLLEELRSGRRPGDGSRTHSTSRR
jgi:acyl-homoserine-lactone acylase